jgi:hypothetical protein
MMMIRYLRNLMAKAVAVERQTLFGSVKIARFVDHVDPFFL